LTIFGDNISDNKGIGGHAREKQVREIAPVFPLENSFRCLSGGTVLTDEFFDFGRFEENGFAGEPHAVQPSLFHPAHDGCAMHTAEPESGFGEREQPSGSRSVRGWCLAWCRILCAGSRRFESPRRFFDRGHSNTSIRFNHAERRDGCRFPPQDQY